MTRRLIPVLTALLVVAGCSGPGSEESSPPTASASSASSAPTADGLPADAVVTYAFYDSSVPPQYHRSMALIGTRDEARIVIDSYGDVLADESTPMPAGTWEQLGATLTLLEGLEIEQSEQGCTGGTSVDLTVIAGSTTIVALAPEFCAGSNEAAGAAIDEWIAPLRALFPPTDVLAPEQP